MKDWRIFYCDFGELSSTLVIPCLSTDTLKLMSRA